MIFLVKRTPALPRAGRQEAPKNPVVSLRFKRQLPGLAESDVIPTKWELSVVKASKDPMRTLVMVLAHSSGCYESSGSARQAAGSVTSPFLKNHQA